MRDDPRVVVWGEDVTHRRHGPDPRPRGRVRPGAGPSTAPSRRPRSWALPWAPPIGGLRPVVDIMFSSFAYVAFDQLVNQAGRLRYMTGGQLAVPLVVIGSAGAAGSNAAQHSEVPSALFLQAAGSASPSRRPRTRLSGSCAPPIESDDPVVVLHHPALAATRGACPRAARSRRRRGRSRRERRLGLRHGHDGPPRRAAARSLDAEGISAEVVDVCSLEPDALGRHPRVGREDRPGRRRRREPAHLLGRLRDRRGAGRTGFRVLRTGIRRLAVPDVPIPFAPNLEQAVIPGEDDIAAVVRETVRG